ncbi:PP0621 family protein [Marinomonas sp. PE14-40]|uniref:PP0621 family protein n=1 Tax=Marinomonas sp. PE14-40 TaxID=3060621 RepID=UPI003F67E871
MIVRLIVFTLIFLLLWWLFRNIRALINQRSEQVNKKENKSHPEEEMISCKVCGVYTPRSHAVKGQNNHFYCSKEHYLEDQ